MGIVKMPDKQIITLILPDLGSNKDLGTTLNSLKSIMDKVEVLACGLPEEDRRFPDIKYIQQATPGNLAFLINTALPFVNSDYCTVVQPGTEISPDLPDILIEAVSGSEEYNYLYGDYLQKDQSGSTEMINANPCPEDITEREDWGPLEIYRTSALRDMGGCDETIRFRIDYDLHLKLTADKPVLHIKHPLCTMPFQQPQAEPGSETLFFPGRGKLGGFSYLFMSPEEEKETEAIFYRFLEQRGAYLNASSGSVFPITPKQSPRVSVVIPVHNRANFLPLAIGSVQGGSFDDFEIIIVDNASQDDTLTVAKALAEKDRRITVISLEDNVIAKALNRGVEQAKGKYIAQLDSDDEYTADTLSSMVKQLDEHSDWALAISYYELMNESGQTLDEFGIIKHAEYNRNNILRVDGAGAVRVWRKAAIVEFGGFNEDDFGHYGEDYDLVLKVSEKYEVGRVYEVLYRYRRHPGNSDVLRSHTMKIQNKTLARQRALKRRQFINQGK
ncbi:hypothetical protein CEE37_08370 [candidate division LCP-89 bacterium B3_LCP]|uniref:Glycosyltransferase 2-like domain-containing protein n=1 Tax=candidate division LCP-89 bacterium B3_LCP TaxID=2012998 RepID=A0A532UZF3_UNCL8|nr:MAG: hypothetical protein CEE37_08370 [candidate division LCP-89 bacterium B3_LCP]